MSVEVKQYAWDIVGEAMRAASLSENAESSFCCGDFLASLNAASEASETFENLRLRAHNIEVRARSAWLGEDLSNPRFQMGLLNQESGQEDAPTEPTKRKRTRRHRRHRKSSVADSVAPEAEDGEGMPISNLPSMEGGLENIVVPGDVFSFEKMEETLEVGMRLRVLPGTKLVVDQVEYYRAGDIGVVTKFYSDTVRSQERFGIMWERTSKSTTASKASWRKFFSIVPENASDAPTDLPDSSEEEEDVSPPSSPQLQCKRIPGRPALTVTSAELGAPFEVFEAPSNEWEDWLMLGHGIRNELILVKESQLVRRASSWRCCWQQGGGGNGIAIYVPECDDPNYVACGAIFLNEEQNKLEPRMDFPVAVVHKSVAELVPLETDFWPASHPLSAASLSDSDSDVGAIVTKVVPRMNTVWPVPQSSTPAMCYSIKSALRYSLSLDLASCRGFENLNWEIRNTFVDLPAMVDPTLVDFAPRRGWYSAPATPRGRRAQSPAGMLCFEDKKENEQEDDNDDEEGAGLNADADAPVRHRRRRVRVRGRRKKSAAAAAAAAALAAAEAEEGDECADESHQVDKEHSKPSGATAEAQLTMQPMVQLFALTPVARPDMLAAKTPDQDSDSWAWMGMPFTSSAGSTICMSADWASARAASSNARND